MREETRQAVTAAELIEELQAMPPDAEVWMSTESDCVREPVDVVVMRDGVALLL